MVMKRSMHQLGLSSVTKGTIMLLGFHPVSPYRTVRTVQSPGCVCSAPAGFKVLHRTTHQGGQAGCQQQLRRLPPPLLCRAQKEPKDHDEGSEAFGEEVPLQQEPVAEAEVPLDADTAELEEEPGPSGQIEEPTYAQLLAEARRHVKGAPRAKELDRVLTDLQSEFAGVLAQMAAAETQAKAGEAALRVSKEQWVRLNADFDNFRKRSANEKLQLTDSVRGDVIKQLIPLVDNFEAAKGAVKAETEGEQRVAESYQSLYKQMVEIFRALGVDAVPGVGCAFDPNFHDAVMREPNDDVPDGTVLQEFRKGFRIGDRLVRPAMVKVSFSDAPAAAGSNGATGADANGAQQVPVEEEVSSS